MKCTFIAAALLCIAVATKPISARDVYVNNVVGNDAASGRNEIGEPGDGPVRTINRALRLVDRGGRVILTKTDEPYREMISLSDVNQRGYSDQPLVIQGNGAVMDGTVAAAEGAWKHEQGDVFSFRPRRLAYQQLFRDGEPLRHIRTTPESNMSTPLEPLEWTLLTDRIAFRTESGKLPHDYNLRHAGLQTGITLYNTEFVRIEDVIIQGFQQDGINAHELARNCELVRVECRSNGRSGISVGGVSRVTILHANCYDNGRSQLRLEGLARVTAKDCDFDEKNANVPWLEVKGGQAMINGQLFQPAGLR